MSTLDWSKCPAVESIPGKVSGAWVFKDTRLPVSVVFENLEAGATIDEITDWFHIARDKVVTVLEFAARSLDAQWPVLRGYVERVVAAVSAATPGSYSEVEIPFR